jgi:hypothetical protein
MVMMALQPMMVVVQNVRIALMLKHRLFVVVAAVLQPIMILQRRRRLVVVLRAIEMIALMVTAVQNIRTVLLPNGLVIVMMVAANHHQT